MNNEAVEVAQEILFKIKQIDKGIALLKPAAKEKAEAISEYDKAIAVTILKLQNGAIEEWEGQKIGKLTATVIPSIAKGICSEQKRRQSVGESGYKSVTTKLDSIASQLNGYQSINKHLASV